MITRSLDPRLSEAAQPPARRAFLRSPTLVAALVTVGIALAYLPQLGNPRGETRPEEGYSMAITAEMQRDGTWATPTLEGKPLFFKPPLLYWAERASYDLFGLNVFAARLPAALAAIVLALLTGLLASSLGASGALAALLCAGCAGLYMIGRLAVTDAPLALCLTCAFGLLWRAHARGDGRWLWASGVFVGLAVLAKGPVAGVIFLVGAVAFALLRARPRPDPLLRPRDLALAIAFALAVAAPWYVLMLVRHGRVFYDFFFVSMNVDRFRTPWRMSSLGVLWGGLVGMLLPWLGLAAAGLVDAVSGSRRSDPRRLFLLCWAAAVMVVFSAPAQKFPHYGLPAIPALAILGAILVRERAGSRAFAWGARINAVICGVIASVALVCTRFLPLFWGTAATLALALTAAAYGLRRPRSAAALGTASLALTLGWLLPAAGFSPWPQGPLPEGRVDIASAPGLVELASGRVVHFLGDDEVEPALARGDMVLLHESDYRGPPDEVVAAQRRFRTSISFQDLVRAIREGSPDPLIGRVLIVARPGAQGRPGPRQGANDER